MPFPEDHVAHRQRHRSVGALLRAEPDVGEFRRLAIVGRDRHRGRALVANLGHEMGVGRACLRHVRAPHHQEGRVVPVGAFRHVGLLAPGLRAGRRKIAIPVVETHADAADQRQIARARRIRDHRHGRNRRKADDTVRSVGLDRVDVGRRDDLVDLVPVGADEAAQPPDPLVVPARGCILDDGRPGRDRRHCLARLAPVPDQPAADQRIFEPVGAVDVPGIAGAPRTAAGLVIRQVRPGPRIVGLLRLPGDDPALDVDLPTAGAGAIHAVSRAHDLVVLPARPVGILPVAILIRDDAVPVGKGVYGLPEEGQSIQEMAHRVRLLTGSSRRRSSADRTTSLCQCRLNKRLRIRRAHFPAWSP